jgi:photosystem II stability/assembly factor-like uncharacterized protein
MQFHLFSFSSVVSKCMSNLKLTGMPIARCALRWVISILISATVSYAQCTWGVQRPPDFNHFYRDIKFVDRMHGWVARSHGPSDNLPLLRTTDGGLTWDSISFTYPPFNVNFVGDLTSLWFIDSLRGWASNIQRMLKTTDGGLTWKVTCELPYPLRGFGAVQFADSLLGWSVGPDTLFNVTQVRRTTDGGVSWSSTQLFNSTADDAMQFVDRNHGWTIGEQIFATTDGGKSWNRQKYDSSTVGSLFGVSFVDTLEGWCCSNNYGRVIHTTDGGTTWTTLALVDSTQQVPLRSISFINKLDGWVFGYAFYQGDLRSAIYQTTDGGHSWTQASIGLAGSLRVGVVLDACHAWALSYGDGSILALEKSTIVVEPELVVPATMSISQNYPNPFNPTTKIVYRIAKRENITLKVYDSLGREVRVLVDGTKETGTYAVDFNASSLSSGIYYVRLSSPSTSISRKMVLVR